ncbi:hypothetical protein CLU85_3996 [Acidovorax sp. 69]|nr:hypothetical protein CLU85_3996 [Acidovorax sp. 69]
MKHPLSRFAPSPSLDSLRESGRPQRTHAKRRLRGLAALARGRWLRPRQFHAQPT